MRGKKHTSYNKIQSVPRNNISKNVEDLCGENFKTIEGIKEDLGKWSAMSQKGILKF